MKTINIQCNNCGKYFDKPLNEYNRRLKLNSPMYCSRKCASRNNINNLGTKRNTVPPLVKVKANPFKYYLRNCKRRIKHDFDLTVEYLERLWEEQQGICPYSKVKLILNTHKIRHQDPRFVASLDRIDNSKGYVKGNVQFVSMSMNYMKHTMSHFEFLDFLKLIFSNFLEDRTISSSDHLMLDAVGSP